MLRRWLQVGCRQQHALLGGLTDPLPGCPFPCEPCPALPCLPAAAAMSLVFHSAHPFIPTLRADVRLFEVRPASSALVGAAGSWWVNAAGHSVWVLMGMNRSSRGAPGRELQLRCGLLLSVCTSSWCPWISAAARERTQPGCATPSMAPPPRRWKGRCGTAAAATSPPFTCRRATLQSSTPFGRRCATGTTRRWARGRVCCGGLAAALAAAG